MYKSMCKYWAQGDCSFVLISLCFSFLLGSILVYHVWREFKLCFDEKESHYQEGSGMNSWFQSSGGRCLHLGMEKVSKGRTRFRSVDL